MAKPRMRRNRVWLLARLALIWETFWPCFGPAIALAGLFAAVALFDILPALPAWLHGAILAGHGAALLIAVGWGMRRFTLPSAEDVARRLERDSGLSHHPLAALDDTLAAGQDDPLAQALWQAHRDRMSNAIRHLKVAPPLADLARRDPYGLRALVLIVLVIAMAAPGGDWGGRFERAITPDLTGLMGPPAALQVWISPPPYTRKPPRLLESGQTDAVVVPAGSTLLGLLSGGMGTASISLGSVEQDFSKVDAGADESGQRVEAAVAESGDLVIRQGFRVLETWSLQVVGDRPPSIGLSPPKVNDRGHMRLDYEASDDYGLKAAGVRVLRPGPLENGDSVELALPLAGVPVEAQGAGWHDLTGHPWAGLPVELVPFARDETGQEGQGEAVLFTLPERNFSHPVARAIIAERKTLSALERDTAAGREGVATALDRISSAPAAFDGALPVFLALRTARYRLAYDRREDAIANVQELLWRTALAVEEGQRAMAEQALEQARSDLENALANGASDAELEHLMERFQAAMENLLQTLAQQSAEAGEVPSFDTDEPGDMIAAGELQAMMDRLREMARTGSMDAARQMLSDLSEMMRSLSPMTAKQGEAARQARQALQDLQDVARDQRDVLDRAFRESQRAPAIPSDDDRQNAQTSRDLTETQEALRQRLGRLMERMDQGQGGAPETLGQAEMSMGDAVEALSEQAYGDANAAQNEALNALQQATSEAMENMAAAMGLQRPGGQNGGRDPMGRRGAMPGVMDDGSVTLPTEPELKRAQEILQDIRRRLADPQRSQGERLYLERLLDRF